MDVRVDPGPQDGTVLVTWIPVTLNVTAGGKEKTSPVTGYAVFAGGKRVTDGDSPSSKLSLTVCAKIDIDIRLCCINSVVKLYKEGVVINCYHIR